MPGPPYRETFFNGMGSSHVHKAGTAHSTAAEVLAAVTAKRYRLKAFRLILLDANVADTALNQVWLADGTTPFLGLGGTNLADNTAGTVAHFNYPAPLIVLPAYGVTGTAATAVNIDFTATDALLNYQLDLWYDLID